MSKKLSVKHAAVAYVLNQELNYSQKKIATLMDVSQGTVSNYIKDFKYEMQIRSLKKELADARKLIEQKHLIPQDDIIDV